MYLRMDLKEILHNGGLADFGDCLINFIYALVLSRISGKYCGGRVPNSILSSAVINSGLRAFMGRRVDVHDRGDAAEALIAYAWSHGLLTIEDAVETLALHLNSKSSRASQVDAFTSLLKLIMGRVLKD